MDLFFAWCRVTAPLFIAAKGDVVGQKAGVLNLGIEGNVLLGAYLGWYLTVLTGSIAISATAATGMGIAIGFALWFLTEMLECNKHATGLGIGLVCSGASLTHFRLLPDGFKESVVPQFAWANVTTIAAVAICILGLTLLAFAERRTWLGLAWKLVGEDSRSADLAGLNYRQIKLACSMIACSCAVMAGWTLSVLISRTFTLGIVSGRGWVALCLVIVGQWRPLWILIAVAIWGGLEVLQVRLQTLQLSIPYQLFLMMPYLITMLAILLPRWQQKAPGMLTKTYRRNDDAA